GSASRCLGNLALIARDRGDPARELTLLEDLRVIGRVTIEEGCAIVCIVGEGLRETPGLGARIFNALGRDSINVRMISQGASRLNLGIVVAEAEAEPAVRTLHDELFGGAIPTDADQP
ncbi:MAG: ACT domain-containing protein, partial [Planctomycetota bacterium]